MIKKFSEYISEGLWSDIVKRGTSGDVRKEDGTRVHTCIDVDMFLHNPDLKWEGMDYDDFLKSIIEDSELLGMDIERRSILQQHNSWMKNDELEKIRKFENPYFYMVYDGPYGTDLIVSFNSYGDIQSSGFGNFTEDVDEHDYIEMCKCVATKLKQVGQYLFITPTKNSWVYGGSQDSGGICVFKLIDEGKTYDNDDPDYVEHFHDDMVNEFPELKYVDFILWNFQYGTNIGLPIDIDNMMNLEKYVKFTNEWFGVKVNEGLWSDIVRRGTTGEEREEDKMEIPEQDPVYWWRGVELREPKKYPASELSVWEISNMVVDGITNVTGCKTPEYIDIFFRDEEWDFVVEHDTSYGNDRYTMRIHGSSSPYSINYSKLSMSEKRSIKQRLLQKTFYIYEYEGWRKEYYLREQPEFKGQKGKKIHF